MIFIGYYEHTIDNKNRLAIPAKFRSRLDPERDGKTFVIVPGQTADSLWLYTERHFETLATRHESALIPDDAQLQFEQVFFTLAEALEMDSQGRVVLPERMMARAGLRREVVICGVRDHAEIRARASFMENLDQAWGQFREIQLKAQDAYRETRRHTGPEAG